ncbi:MAG: sigma-54-dependent Fis family transcriptional regulator [Desulfobulbaceae bacterium]|nr:sigma-54-dependent Fis family transcriptional regulator [Desulfobulbaceae bacterium]
MARPVGISRQTSPGNSKSPPDKLVAQILLVDDDWDMFTGLEALASGEEIRLTRATNLQQGLQLNQTFSFDLVLLKDRLPDGAAAETITAWRNAAGAPELIVYTRNGDPNEAEHLLNNGCWDYLLNPSPDQALLEILHSAIRYRREKMANREENHGDLCQFLKNEGVVGSSQELQRCLDMVPKAAQSDANILITGESGTGKELFASAIHRLSNRAAKSLVVVDCAALPRDLVESILFGHRKGAFTGADQNREGLIKQADGGTLFLDEIGELPMSVQKKFLRVLQERRFRPVGGSTEVTSNFHLIAATNRNLRAMCEQKSFREDLLFRLQTFHIELPALRARPSDITELAYHFNERHSHYCKLKEKKFSPDFLMTLKHYEWPGNVRELFNALESAITSAQGNDTLYPTHLPTQIRVQVARKALRRVPPPEAPAPKTGMNHKDGALLQLQTLRDKVIEETEQDYLRKLAAMTGGNLNQALKISGLSRSRLYNLFKKYGISLKNGDRPNPDK